MGDGDRRRQEKNHRQAAENSLRDDRAQGAPPKAADPRPRLAARSQITSPMVSSPTVVAISRWPCSKRMPPTIGGNMSSAVGKGPVGNGKTRLGGGDEAARDDQEAASPQPSPPQSGGSRRYVQSRLMSDSDALRRAARRSAARPAASGRGSARDGVLVGSAIDDGIS